MWLIELLQSVAFYTLFDSVICYALKKKCVCYNKRGMVLSTVTKLTIESYFVGKLTLPAGLGPGVTLARCALKDVKRKY
jgi:hypothetical protein